MIWEDNLSMTDVETQDSSVSKNLTVTLKTIRQRFIWII